jgi:hypothetical protein
LLGSFFRVRRSLSTRIVHRKIPMAPRPSPDPDEAPVIPGLDAYGIDSDSAQSSGVYIPQSPTSSDVPPLLYSSPAFRSH